VSCTNAANELGLAPLFIMASGDNDARYPLSIAGEKGRTEAYRALRAAGRDILALSREGWMAHFAWAEQGDDIVPRHDRRRPRC
jgi:hypothetical protein